MQVRTLTAIAAILVVTSQHSSLARVDFEDVTAAAGVETGGNFLASGSAWRDFNKDGLPDVFVGNHYQLPVLYKNLGNGRFRDVALEVMQKPAGTMFGPWGDKHGAAWADFDNDGDEDLFVNIGAHQGRSQGNKQLYVQSNGRLVDNARELGIQYPLARGRTPTWIDYDNDGRLDVFIGAVPRPDGDGPPTLFRQTGSGFTDVRTQTNFKPLDTLGIWISDLNRDGQMDILFRGKKQSPSGRASRIEVIDTSGAQFRAITPINFRANFPDLAVADFDGDLRPDLFIANSWSGSGPAFGHDLYLNTAGGWVNRTAASRINAISRSSRPSAIAADFDNDMDVDIFLDCGYANGNDLANVMLWNNGNGTFEAEDQNGPGGARGRLSGSPDTATAADYDVDGFIDVYLTYDFGKTQLYHNKGNGNHWLEIDLRGTRSNSDGVGAQVTLTAGGVRQLREQTGGIHRYWGQNDQRLHFGLGSNRTADITVKWPSGAQSSRSNVAADQVITIVE